MIKTEIRDNGIFGTLHTPNNGKLPGIVIAGGSDGGIPPDDYAIKLASQGYTVFALGYFGAEGLPQFIENIPLEYFRNALQLQQFIEQLNFVTYLAESSQ